VKKDKLDRACNTKEKKRQVYTIFAGNYEGKKLVGRPRNLKKYV
jgi:hypothetical protein